MADFFDSLKQDHITFIEAQPMFFTATATTDSRINLSPKGMDSFRVLSPSRCAYLDLTGSGNETAAHLAHDGRLTIMFNSFTRKALIMRLYGRGEVISPQSDEFAALLPKFPNHAGVRQIIAINIETVQTSCGYGVPEMTLERERPTLAKWVESKGEEALVDYREKNNRISIDGLEIPE